MTPSPAPAEVFDDPLWQQLQPILQRLDQRQAHWLSGYLAGSFAGTEAPQQPAGSDDQTVLITFGTETDNCRHLAEQFAQACAAAGVRAATEDLAGVRLRRLSKTAMLVVITATHGDGDPPEPIAEFYEALMADDAPQLSGLKFAVLALGDSSYEHFCATGIAIDERLAALGGERMLPRQDCDVDFEQPAAEWLTRLVGCLQAAAPQMAEHQPGATISSSASAEPVAEYSKRNPLTAEVLTNQNLSHASRAAPIHHLELALEDEGLQLQPGDAVGVMVDNPPELVALVLDATGLSGEQAVTQGDQALPLVEVLREHRDLTIPGKAFLQMWSEVSQSAKLQAVVDADTAVQRQFLRQHQIRDLLHTYPGHPPPQSLVDALRPLQPRLYDVANSLDVVDDELHLTVKSFSYAFRCRTEQGIAAQHLLALAPGDSVRLYPHRNARFHLPEQPDAPIVLIAEGTGIAPYRAFFQTLANRQHCPPCWLIFAEKDFEHDFLYQLEIQQAHRDGVCRHVDATFTDHLDGTSLAASAIAAGDRLASWLAQDGHIYFCGEKASLENSEALIRAYLDETAGASLWAQLVKDKRIHRNVY